MCLSMTGLSAWDNSPYQPKTYYQAPIQNDYEQQSLHNQREALKNQERMIAQQNGPHPGSRPPINGTTRIGR